MSSQEDNIIEDLVKTGFPTEIVSASIMQNREWFVVHNPSYLDDVENKSREFDIRAYRQEAKTIGNTDYTVGTYLVAECKKSEKPWVFFTTPEQYLGARLGKVIKWRLAGNQMFSDRENSKSIISDEDLLKFHRYFREPRLARTFHQPFKGEKEHSHMIHSAVMSVVKATMFLTRGGYDVINQLKIYYPVVIFSGNLFEAQVQPNKQIDLIPSRYLQLSFQYIAPEAASSRSRQALTEFMIDIVHEDHLDEFLRTVEKETEQIAAYFFKTMARDET